MHYDKKIALALGILLVGVVAALFFRRDRHPAPAPPQLADPQSLDDQIQDKPVRPYEPPSPSASAAPGDRTLRPEGSRSGDEGGSGDPFGLQWRISQKRSGDSYAPRLGPPEPIKPGNTGTAPRIARMPPPAANASRDRRALRRGPPLASTGAAQSTDVQQGASVVSFQEYRVQSGDTLSGLALRFLGSSLRYLEIFEANRDVLRSPNDLRAGMVIRIPLSRKAKTRAASARTSSTPGDQSAATSPMQQTRPRSGSKTAGKLRGPLSHDRRFIPVKRSPFILRNPPRKNAGASGRTP